VHKIYSLFYFYLKYSFCRPLNAAPRAAVSLALQKPCLCSYEMTLNQYRGFIFAGGVYHRIRYCLPVTCIHWRHADCEQLTSPIYPCLLGFPVSISKCSDGSQDSKLPLHEKHVVATPLPPSYLGPNIFLNTLFPDTLSLRSSLNVSDQVSHPHKKKQAKL